MARMMEAIMETLVILMLVVVIAFLVIKKTKSSAHGGED